jgi:hypothetical protein
MKRMYGIIVEIPNNFTENVLALYENEEAARKDFDHYAGIYGVNHSINAVIIPSPKQHGYHYFVHGAIHVDVPDSITGNLMKIKAVEGGKIFNMETNTNVSVMIDPKYLSPFGSPTWNDGNLIDLIIEVVG